MNAFSVQASRLATLAAASLLIGFDSSASAADAFIPKLINSSTIPMNGDMNPYGVAFVPEGFPNGGLITAGDVLVSNFNDAHNTQGRGTTIIQLTPSSTPAAPTAATVFFDSPAFGLSTALGVLRRGLVLVGNLPTIDGSFGSIGPGSLQVVDRNGHLLQTLVDSNVLNGPWDLAIDDRGTIAHVFVSNVNTGVVSRLDVTVSASGIKVLKQSIIAKGYTVMPNGPALILGPTGLAFDPLHDVLFVASTADNAIYAIKQAEVRTSPVNLGDLVFADQHLRGPLGLKFAPNGHLVAANGDAVNADAAHPSEIVEFTTEGEFIREYNVDASQGGAFGLDTVFDSDGGFNFGAVDDVTNNLTVYRLPL